MPASGPTTIPVPLSSFPGDNPQESAGRLINCYSEPLGDPQQSNYGAPRDGVVWRRLPGLTQFALTGGQLGYRGGLLSAGVSYEVFAGEALTVDQFGTVVQLGGFPGNLPVSIAANQNATSPDVVAVDPVNGAFVLHSTITPATATATIIFTGIGNYQITFTNQTETLNGAAWPVSIVFPAPVVMTSTQIATGMTGVINANATLSASGVSATSVGAVITINHLGLIGNSTVLSTINVGTWTFSPASGALVGGAGIAGVFTGTPTPYNGQTNLPAVNSVAFQDGYFFFTTAAGSVYASGLNSLTQNALTFGRIIAKAGTTLLRGIAYQGYMFFFTSASIEVWQDAAIAAPGFPYQRTAILPYGLIQSGAIAGFESGFDDLMWVAGDYGVYRMTYGSFTPTKVSPPDLDRLIQKEVLAGNTLIASVYIFSGKKVWVLSSPDWTWTFHLNVQKWFERASLLPNGSYGAWRGIGGHQAFNKWLMGDTQASGALLFLDETNAADIVYQDPTTWTTITNHMLYRIETGLVDNFPVRMRVARADFHFVRGVGSPVGQTVLTITGAAAGANGISLAVLTSLGVNSGDQVQVSGVLGTIEANGVSTATVIDGTHIELQGTTFVNPYISGGTLTDVTIQPSILDPTVAISWSDDGGNSYRPPVLRHLGQLEVIKTGRVAVKAAGMTGQIGRRWRMDITAPVYTAFLRATQSDIATIPN